MTSTIIAADITTLWRKALTAVLVDRTEVPSRNGATYEVLGQHLILTNPHQNVVVAPVRGLNYSFSVAEWLYLMLGHNDVRTISAFNSQMAKFSDDGEFMAGSYGPMLIEQLPYVLGTLTKDPSSRQAALTLWRQRPGPSRDIPCTIAMQFIVRQDKLSMFTTMRSNDLWLGFPYDLFNFTQLQRYLAFRLGYDVGEYHHFAGSFHLYTKDALAATALLNSVPLLGPDGQPFVPSSPAFMSPLPDVIRSTFAGIALWGREGGHVEDMLDQFAGSVPEPWWTYLQVIAYRFHRNASRLPEPYKSVITGIVNG